MKKHLFVLILALSASAAAAQVPAPASTPDSPPPAIAPQEPATITAPQAAAPAPVNNDWMTYHNPYSGEQNDLANPNRTNAEISAWTQTAVASALSFGPEDVNEKVTAAKKMFVASGWTDYASYVKQAQLMERVRQQNLTLSTILNGDAVILNSEAVEKRYRWLVRVPVMMTFISKDVVTKEQKPVGTGKFTLTLQIGRVDKNLGDDGIAIESWKLEAVQP